MRRRKKRRIWGLAVIFCLAASVLAFRWGLAGSYTIEDGGRQYVYVGIYPGSRRMLAAVGIALDEGDSCTFSAGARRVEITRAQRVTIYYHGDCVAALTQGETVAQLLRRLELQPDAEDQVTPAPDTLTQNGMEIRVDKIITQVQTYCVSLPWDTLRCVSSVLPGGTQRTLRYGSEGQLRRTAEVTYCNGQEVSRRVLSESLLSLPCQQIVAVGTGPVPEAAEPGYPIIADGFITLETGEVLTYTGTATVRATAYTHTDEGCDRTTATGTTVRIGTVAVDPRYIPYGTRMFIMASDGSYVYGIARAEDCGGDIKGDRMDLYMPTYDACMGFGRRVCTVYYLG